MYHPFAPEIQYGFMLRLLKGFAVGFSIKWANRLASPAFTAAVEVFLDGFIIHYCRPGISYLD